MTPSPYVPARPVHRPGVNYLTVQEVAAELRVSKMTVYRIISRGDMAAIRVGRSLRVPENALNGFIRHADESMWSADE